MPPLNHKLPHPADFVGDRRRFLEVMGASLALASGGCLPQPKETIVPAVKSPEYAVPGVPRYFASAITLGGYATGVLVESHEGRPTRIDGNPDHPASMGAVDAITQSAILSLYDPDRSQAITKRGTIRTWEALADDVKRVLSSQRTSGGRGVRILTETVTSPTLYGLLSEWLEKFPSARWHQYEPINQDQVYDGMRLAFGRPLDTRLYPDRADVILAIDRDFLASGPGHLRYARQYMSRRQPEALARPGGFVPNRMYVIEPMPTPTGATADHRLALSPGRMSAAVEHIAAKLGVLDAAESDVLSKQDRHFLDVAAGDLAAHRQRALLTGGWTLSPDVHALIARINAALGSVGESLDYTEPVVSRPETQLDSLRKLASDMERGDVELLLILEGNPAYTAPADLDFARRLTQAPLSIHLSPYEDETSAVCQWHVPAAHPLESWGDARAIDGSVSIIQPLIAPLYGGKSPIEMIDLLLVDQQRSGYILARDHWRQRHGDEGLEAFWHQSLHAGVIEGTQSPAVDAALTQRPTRIAPSDEESDGMGIMLRPDPTIYDGRFANYGWLQELPKPISKLTWQNAAFMSPPTAARFDVTNEDVVEIAAFGRSVHAATWIVPGHADGCVTLHLGHGRRRGGRLCDGSGANAYALLSSESPLHIRSAEVTKTGQKQRLAPTQHHHQMEGRDLVRQQLLQLQQPDAQPSLIRGHDEEHPSLYDSSAPLAGEDEYAWGMSINLGTCTGCSACVIACQAENNIPVAGREQVQLGREMHWIRVDSYFEPREGDWRILHQPVPCMHCENSPCETVCPVAATVHSAEGLNEMVYNRCVGTRYCSNNCPYKVRRFNFLDYQPDPAPVLELLPNPNVTVRSRGVMEKCTYCVQRISAARIAAKREGGGIRDGDVVTACEAACPTQAIVFGDIHDRSSRVAQRKASPLDYGLLTELNTRPRTTYLPWLHHPHPDL